MKYLAQTFSYLKKNGWLPLLVMLVPSIASCFLYKPFWEVSFLASYNYDATGPMRLSRVFAIIFGDSWQYLWPMIIMSILQVVASSLVMSAIDRHFRSGKLSLRSPFRLINNSIFPMAIGVTIMCVISVLLRFALFGLVALVQVIAEAARFSAGLTLAIIAVIAVVLFILHILVLTPILYWSPVMFMYGYKFRDAAGLSFKLISGKKLFIGLLIPMAICAGLQLLVEFLGVHIAIECVCNGIIFYFINVYVTVYVILTFYRISNLDRRDVLPYELSLPEVPNPTAVKSTDKKHTVKSVESQTEENTQEKSEKPSKSAHVHSSKPDRQNKTAASKPTAKKTQKNKKSAQSEQPEKESGDGI